MHCCLDDGESEVSNSSLDKCLLLRLVAVKNCIILREDVRR